MTTLKLKRRSTGAVLVPGTAPLSTGVGGILSGEPVWDNLANILYIGGGDDGSGNSTSIKTVAGTGAFVPFNSVGAANGVASLDASGKVTTAQLPASLTGAMVYQGTWNAATNIPALVSGAGSKGFFYKVSAVGATALDGTANWNVGDIVCFDGTTWDKIDGPAEAVTTVAGRIGAITLTSNDVTDATVTGKTLLTSATPASALAALAGAPLAAPSFTGIPAAPTATSGTNTTQLATTAFVQTAVAASTPTGIDGGVI